MIKLVILSGGAGTRLWPFSRTDYPKQFFNLTGKEKPMIIETVDRLSVFGPVSVVTTKNLETTTRGFLERFDRKNVDLICEPEARNTAAPIAMMVAKAWRKKDAEVVAFFPADHQIKIADEFEKVLDLAINEARKGKIVTIGIKPDHPSSAYGYLKFSDNDEGVKSVESFIEKPDRDLANKLIHEGDIAWNAGIFIGSVQKFAEEFERHMPELWNMVLRYVDGEEDVYSELPAISIDYGLMEKLNDLKCVPGDFGWCDIGSWEEAVSDERLKADPSVEIAGGSNKYAGLFVDKKKSVFVGVSDLIVVDTPDALMVMKKGEGQSVKKAVSALKSIAEGVTREHLFQERPWGRFENMRDEEHCKVKKLIVDPGKRISYQRHKFRSEHWIIVKGVADVTLDGETVRHGVGENVYVKAGTKHRLGNSGNESLEVIEVQYGTYFGEDDIERFSDDFGRS